MKTAINLSILGIFALLPIIQAVSPPPDGAYAGGNTAEGQNSLLSLSGGLYNTALGFFSLESNAAGNFNTAVGAGALFATTADENTATGAGALFSNTTGEGNAAHGVFALFNNTDGSNNTANGAGALFTNKTGRNNTAAGAQGLFSTMAILITRKPLTTLLLETPRFSATRQANSTAPLARVHYFPMTQETSIRRWVMRHF